MGRFKSINQLQDTLIFNLEATESLDPDKVSFIEPYMKSNDFKSIPCYEEGNSPDSTNSIKRSSTRNQQQNQFFGYFIKQIKSNSQRTEILTISSKIFKKYVSHESPYNDLSDKYLKDFVDEEFGLNNASVR